MLHRIWACNWRIGKYGPYIKGSDKIWYIMNHTKSCWLSLEAIVVASWTMLEGSAVISAALRPKRAKTSSVTNFMITFNKTVLSLIPYHSVFLRSALDWAGMYTLLSQHQCQHCVCAEPPCAGSPHWDKETQVGTAQESVWQIEWTPANSKYDTV